MVEKKRKRSEHAAKRAQVRGEEAWSIAAWSNDEADGTESGSPLCSSNGDNLWRSDDREWIATLETHAACFESPGALAGTSSVDDDDASSLSSGSDCSEPETICEDDAGLTDTEMQAHVADALQRINALYDMGYTTHRERILFVKWTIMCWEGVGNSQHSGHHLDDVAITSLPAVLHRVRGRGRGGKDMGDGDVPLGQIRGPGSQIVKGNRAIIPAVTVYDDACIPVQRASSPVMVLSLGSQPEVGTHSVGESASHATSVTSTQPTGRCPLPTGPGREPILLENVRGEPNQASFNELVVSREDFQGVCDTMPLDFFETLTDGGNDMCGAMTPELQDIYMPSSPEPCSSQSDANLLETEDAMTNGDIQNDAPPAVEPEHSAFQGEKQKKTADRGATYHEIMEIVKSSRLLDSEKTSLASMLVDLSTKP
jgi:hypothetical protein